MNGAAVSDGEVQEASVEKACQEYNKSVKTILTLINRQLSEILAKNYEDLEELGEKIGARANFLQKNPYFLSSLTYRSSSVKIQSLNELDDIKITLKEYSRRITEKVDEIDKSHSNLFELVDKSSQDRQEDRIIEEIAKAFKQSEEDVFEDCVADVKNKTEVTEEDDETGSIPTLENEEIKPKEENLIVNDTKEENHVEVSRDTTEEHQIKVLSSSKSNNEETKLELESKVSFDRVVIQKNAYSDVSLDKKITENLPNLPLKQQLFPDVPAEVERRKPFEDLHGKLLKQLEASDSLESFVRLMERKPSKQKKFKEVKKSEQIEEKYTGSLYFFPEKAVKRKKSTTPPSSTPSQKSTKAKQKQASSTCCELMITSSQPPSSNQEKTRRVTESLGRTKLKYYDLLDDLEGKDLKPIKSEYPRRDNLYEKYMQKMKLHEAKSYLHRMMEENEKVWKKLIKPPEPKKVKQAQNLIRYLTAPQEQKFIDHRPQTLIVMPVKVVYDNYPTKDNLPELRAEPATRRNPVMITDLTQALEEQTVESPKRQVKISPKIGEVSPKMCVARPKSGEVNPKMGVARSKSGEANPKMGVASPKSWETNPKVGVASPKPGEAANTKTGVASPKTVEANPKTSEAATKKPEPKPITYNFPVQRKREILEHLKGLKLRNNNIQKNIQKAIDVIETKMIDLISSPTDVNNAEAFNAMEQEITNVLKMMSDNDRKKDEKMEAEKDESSPKSPSMKRAKTIVKTPRSVSPSPKRKQPKKIANIEDGERLLGQVDSVIKKIDNISTKFSDDKKPKKLSKKDNSYNNVIDFFDGLKNILESPVKEIFFIYKIVSVGSEKATCHWPSIVYHEAVFILPERKPSDKGDFIEPFFALERQCDIYEDKHVTIDIEESEQMREERHETILKRFYTFFFSTIFVMLNFDYAA